MGSFNTTCFASGQTIAPKDRCFVLPIIQAHTSRPVNLRHGKLEFQRYGVVGSVTWPEAFWQSFGSFIKATYNDCGSVRPADNPDNRGNLLQFFIALASRAAVVEQGKNAYHDVPFDFPGFVAEKAPLLAEIVKAVAEERVATVSIDDDRLFSELLQAWDYAAEAISEHRLFAVDDNGDVFPVEFAILHAVAHDRLTELHGYVMDGLEQLNIRITPMVYASQDYVNGVGKMYSEFVQAARQAVDEERRQR